MGTPPEDLPLPAPAAKSLAMLTAASGTSSPRFPGRVFASLMPRIMNIAAAQPTKQPTAEPRCQSSACPITKAAALPTNMKKIDDIKHIANMM
jgi:hypothetical protein